MHLIESNYKMEIHGTTFEERMQKSDIFYSTGLELINNFPP